jgi:hypothetical protein
VVVVGIDKRRQEVMGGTALPSIDGEKPEEVEGLDLPWPVVEANGADLVRVDPFTGACKTAVPLRIPKGRSDFTPSLELTYDSRRGASVFGLGWEVDVSSVARSLGNGTPRYNDTDDSFELDHAELVVALRSNGGWVDDRFEVGEYSVLRYRRRNESSFERIERWVHQPSGQTHWRSVDCENITSLYGISDSTRVSDPTDSTKIVEWLLAERFDDKGNVVRFVYKPEDLAGVSDAVLLGSKNAGRGAARYLKRVLYGNVAPHDRGPWHFEVVFDYGEHDDIDPTPRESHTWSVRPDPVVDSSAGFEVALLRRCRRVLTFHRFPEIDTKTRHVSTTEFTYGDIGARSVLESATYSGHMTIGDDVESKSLPALKFAYGEPEVNLVAGELESPDIASPFADERSVARWTDFYQEGLPGVLYRSANEWNYIRNLGNGRFAEPQVVPHEEHLPAIDLREQGLSDDQITHERDYQPLTSMRSHANPQHDDQYVGYLDLNGDHADDVIVAGEDVVRWYPSQGDEGFGDPVVLRLESGERVRARRLAVEENQSFHVADMTGDGVYDLVRIRNNEVCYWPGRGRGRFGDKVKMRNAPDLEGAQPSQVVLADINGNGATDLVLLGAGTVSYWENRGGAEFGARKQSVANGVTPETEASAVDVFGRGTDAIVWLDANKDNAQVRFLATSGLYTGGLMSEINNGKGVRTRISYVSTADLWRRDRDAGREWIFSSPVTTKVVERLEVRDWVSNVRGMHRYVFRNAAFDEARRKLIGFAASEEWQGGLAEDYALPGLFADEPVPEVAEHRRSSLGVTKRWFHTGSMAEGEDLTEELVSDFYTDEATGRHRWLVRHELPEGLAGREVGEAFRSLRGWLLRKEEVGPNSDVPYRVLERTASVHQVQPRRSDRLASYHARLSQAVEVEYDAAGKDPRIVHTANTRFDAFGCVEQGVRVAYKRRSAESAGQDADLVHLIENTYCHRADLPTWYRVCVLASSTKWVVKAPRRAKLALLELKDLAGLFGKQKKERVAARRWRYWSNDLSTVLGPGELESRALLARSEDLVFTDAMVSHLFDDEDIEDLLRYEGGYDHDDVGWWAPGTTYAYDAARFYDVSGERNALGHERHLRRQPVGSELRKSADSFGNVSTSELHPRSLQWSVRIDVNGNEIVRRFDPLGAVLSVASVGKKAQATGDAVDVSSKEPSAKDSPTAVVTYGQIESGASVVHIRHRERHGDTSTGVFEKVIAFDPFGRSLSTASRSGGQRWCVEALVERNDKGAVVREAQSFYSDSPIPGPAEAEEALGAGRQLWRDVTGAVVRVDEADGTTSTMRRGPWSMTLNDATDNVLDSDWYRKRQGSYQGRAGDFGSQRSSRHVFETRASAQSAIHAQTPEHQMFDVHGKVCLARQSLSRSEFLEHGCLRDAMGRIVERIDSEQRIAVRLNYDLTGRIVRRSLIDAGDTTELRAASGELLREYLPGAAVLRYRYDSDGRCTHVFESIHHHDERLVQRTIWGGGETSVEGSLDNNLTGKVCMQLDSAGLEIVEARDHNGRPTKVSYHPSRLQTHDHDWSGVADLQHGGQLLERLTEGSEMLVSRQPLTAYFRYDALGRLVRMAGPDKVRYRLDHGDQASVESVDVNGQRGVKSLLSSVRYDADRQLAAAQLGGSVRTRRRYDSRGRPIEIVAALADRQTRVQDQQLVYDAAGNLTCVTEFGELTASFTYDAINRLTRAEGFEPAEGGNGVRRYTNSYELDGNGNLRSLSHHATGVEWARTYGYEDGSNKLRAASRPGGQQSMAASYDYDASGNLTSGANHESLVWDSHGRLVGASVEGVSIVFGYLGGQLIRRLALRDDDITELFRWGPFELTLHRQSGKLISSRIRTHLSVAGLNLVAVEEDDDDEIDVTVRLIDQVGSVIGELNDDGTPVTEEEYSVFGVPWLRRSRNDIDLALKTDGFRGGMFDADLALLYVDQRWYSPWLGRYIDTREDRWANPYALPSVNPQRVDCP